MALDMHSKVKVKEVLQMTVDNGYVLLQVSYRVKRGRKDYKIWLLPRDLRECGIFPLAYNSQGQVITLKNQVIYSGTVSIAEQITRIANKDYMEGA